MERTVRERIKFIKQAVEKHKLTIKDVADLCDKNGAYLHEKTIAKFFKEDSEGIKYQYNTIISVYEAIYNAYGDEDIPDDATALKRIIAERNRQIDNLLMQIEKGEEHHKEQLKLCEDRKGAYEKTISLLEKDLEQINSRFDKVLGAYLELKESV